MSRSAHADPVHIARVAANILRLVADEYEADGWTHITPDNLRAQAAALDKVAKP